MLDGNTPQKRIRRRTSLLPGNATTTVLNLASAKSPEQAEISQDLVEYIKSTDETRKKWEKFESDLKVEYTRLKRNLTKPNEDISNFNYLDYLEEDEKNFLSEVEDMKKKCKQYMNDMHYIKQDYVLLHHELKNKRKQLIQFINKKREISLNI